MTMPHLMNCQHSDSGWCLECVAELHSQTEQSTTGRPDASDVAGEIDRLIDTLIQATAHLGERCGLASDIRGIAIRIRALAHRPPAASGAEVIAGVQGSELRKLTTTQIDAEWQRIDEGILKLVEHARATATDA